MTTSMGRKPMAYRLGDAEILVADAPGSPAALDAVLVTREPDMAALPDASAPRLPLRRGRSAWATVFWSASAGLVLLGLCLAVVSLIEDLFTRAQWLGAFGLALAVLAITALIAVIIREGLGLARLATIERLREQAAAILANDDRTAAAALIRDLLGATRRTPQLARSRARLQHHLGDIIDGRDLVRLAERELMAPLDEEARRMVAAAAQRVSVVTAVSPRAAVDMLFVGVTVISLMRRLAMLYGGRPGTIGLIRLARHVVSHLAVTGGMAASDSLVQQVIGHGLAAKLSARLGEGMLNGLLTARLGLAAIEVTRPLPFTALRRPRLNDLVGTMLRSADRPAPEAIDNDDRRDL
jgi:putative membrane protein